MTVLVVVLTVIILYWESIAGEFLFDDPAILDMDFPRRMVVIAGGIDWDDPGNRASPPRPAVEMITAPTLRRSLTWFTSEPRALTHLGYYWTWRLAGFNPIAWHLVNIGLHLVNTGMVYLFARVFLKPEPAGFAAVLFAFHPHQVATVAYISGRAGLQTTFFALAGLYIAWFIPDHPFANIPAYLLAVFFAGRSKEDGVLWLLIFAASAVVFRFYFGLT